jgi:hypothetical protein
MHTKFSIKNSTESLLLAESILNKRVQSFNAKVPDRHRFLFDRLYFLLRNAGNATPTDASAGSYQQDSADHEVKLPFDDTVSVSFPDYWRNDNRKALIPFLLWWEYPPILLPVPPPQA